MVNHAPTYRVLRRKREARPLSFRPFALFQVLVGLDGLEPSTSRLSGARSSHLSYRPVSSSGFFQFVHLQGFHLDGGDEGNRTLDPLLAGQVLSQLSYTPIFWVCSSGFF